MIFPNPYSRYSVQTFCRPKYFMESNTFFFCNTYVIWKLLEHTQIKKVIDMYLVLFGKRYLNPNNSFTSARYTFIQSSFLQEVPSSHSL